MPVLYCRHLDKHTQWKVVTGESFTLGFSNAASVPVPDESLAPREVGVSRAGDRYILRDLAERGRVLLNGMAAREGLLEDGDRVQVGRISILFLDDARARGGEVDLYPQEAGPEADAKRWESLEAEGDRGGRPASPPAAAERRKAAFLVCLAISLIAGLAIGLLVVRPPGAPNRGPRAAAKTVETTSPDHGTELGGGNAEQGTEPAAAREESSPAKEGARPEGEPTRSSARIDPAQDSLRVPPPPAPAILAAGPYASEGASRLVLFRLFLDVAGRPPTREEERTMLPLSHEERLGRAVDTARREGSPGPPASVASLFQLWIGRPPSPEEAREISAASSPERPPAFWISSRPEYASFERRRSRSVRQRARGLIVDLLDRPPADEAEVELVEAALREPRALDELARALVHSPESRLGEDPLGSWETEFFRFFLRAPGPVERAEIERVLEGLSGGAAKRYLALALVSFPEYRSY